MGRNLLKFKKNLMTSSLIRKYEVIIVILMLVHVQNFFWGGGGKQCPSGVV